MKQNMTDHNVLIANYLEGHITPEGKDALMQWVRASKENEDYFVQMAKVWEESTIELQDKESARKAANMFFARMQAKKRRKLYRWVASSAAAVLLLLLGLQMWDAGLPFGERMLTVATCDSKKEVILPDSSIVWLNARSELTYPKKFGRKRRNVALKGEAFFDVRKDKKRPFSVNTPTMTVRVSGTTFVVTDREELPHAETVLETGKVDVTVKETGRKLEMQPDRQLIYNKKDKSTEMRVVNASAYTNWRKEYLLFENTPLRDVFIQLGKWYNISISCKTCSPKLLDTPVSFTLDNETVDDILSILQSITPLTWEKTGTNEITIE
ncbi:FecR family protein [Bacteroides heparinolyticus]|uniref:FecR family protein n=1 Tax=Prevotella heparinolytica TaxID=28113 RepID=UPI0035A1597D